MRQDFEAAPDDAGRRLESVLRRLLPAQSLPALHRALRQGDVRLNGAKAGPEARVAAGDRVSVWTGLLGPEAERPAPGRDGGDGPDLDPSWIVYEGGGLLVLNKPAGLLVHPDRPDQDALDRRVRRWLAPRLPASLSFRPGPLHRLDRGTSGLVVFSTSLGGARGFSAALAARQVTKVYLAVLRGELPGPRTAEAPLSRDEAARHTRTGSGGLASTTRFTPRAWAGGLTLAEVCPETGRTHQIRAHARHLGLPLAGDTRYQGGPRPAGLDVPWLLHAWTLEGPGLAGLRAPLPPARLAWLEKTFKLTL